MWFLTGNDIMDGILMVFYIALALGILSTIADDEGPIHHDPDY